jgi:UDP-2,3-diacylglucosamine pyrophosphatase LpxH
MRVVSDFHLGGCWAAHTGTRDKLMQFLAEMADPANDNGPPITHLVLLGDMWDWWLVPLDQEIPHPAELFESTDAFGYNIPEVRRLVKNIAKRMKVYLIRGNHDDISSKELAQKAFGDSVQFMEDGLEINGVWMEHGNIFDMYSTVPRKRDEPKKQGMSYFVTRIQAAPTGFSCKRAVTEGKDGPFHDAMAKAINNQVHSLEVFDHIDFEVTPEIFAPKYYKPLLMQVGENWTTTKVTGMQTDGISFNYHDKSSNYTLGDVYRDHEDDGRKMIANFGGRGTMARMLATGMDNARMYAKGLRRHLVMISGHSHMPFVERITRDKPSKVSAEAVYANSGAWTFDNYGRHLSSYVDVTFDKVEDDSIPSLQKGDWRPTLVNYYEYPEKLPREFAEVPIPKAPKASWHGWEHGIHPDTSEMVIGTGKEGIWLTDPEQ